jgi:hypothetical protein
MTISSRRLNQIIARRKLARPKHRTRHLQNLGYQLDGITEDFPTTETPYKREPFIHETCPEIFDVTAAHPTDTGDLTRERVIKFGTITEYPIDNLPYNHPSGSDFPPSSYPDWNRHAPILADFFNFLDTTSDDEDKAQAIAEFWIGRFRAPPVEAIIQQQLAARAQIGRRLVPVPPLPQPRNEEEDTTIPPSISLADNEDHPSDEESVANSSVTTPSELEELHRTYCDGPAVCCSASRFFPGRDVNAGIYSRCYFTHYDASGDQFTILPRVRYHFNDVTVVLDDNRRHLHIRAKCPVTVDVSTVPDYEDTSNLPEPTRYNLRNINRTPRTNESSDEDSEPTPEPFYNDPDYTLSDEEQEDEVLLIDTNNSGTSTNESSNADYTTNSTPNARVNLSLPDTIDLTQSDSDEDSAGDIILLNISTSTENV